MGKIAGAGGGDYFGVGSDLALLHLCLFVLHIGEVI